MQCCMQCVLGDIMQLTVSCRHGCFPDHCFVQTYAVRNLVYQTAFIAHATLQVSVGDIMLVDGGLSTFKILSKTPRDVHMEVVDGGRMTSRSVTSDARTPSSLTL